MHPKHADGMANSVDPDQTAPPLFAKTCLSKNIGSLRYEPHPQENLFMPYANNNGADQPAHACSLISTFVVRCLDSIILLVSISEISGLYLAFVGSHMAETGFLMTCLYYEPREKFNVQNI